VITIKGKIFLEKDIFQLIPEVANDVEVARKEIL
jgi:hypothetical protein